MLVTKNNVTLMTFQPCPKQIQGHTKYNVLKSPLSSSTLNRGLNSFQSLREKLTAPEIDQLKLSCWLYFPKT